MRLLTAERGPMTARDGLRYFPTTPDHDILQIVHWPVYHSFPEAELTVTVVPTQE